MKTTLSGICVGSLIMLFMFLVVCPGFAQVPRTMNYQGSLEQATDGNPVNGSVSMTFKLYDALTGGNELWNEMHAAVTVEDGIYSVILGTVTPLDTLAFDQPYYLEITIDGEVLTPRQPLTSVPYAQRAAGMDEITVQNGNVGIGTTDPTRKLDVNGHLHLSGSIFTDGHLLGWADRPLVIYPNTSAWSSRGWIEFMENNIDREGELGLAGTYIDLRYGSTTQTAGTTGMRLTADGNVGIGTLTPQYKLDVNGIIRGNNVSPSDARFKKDIQQLDRVLERLMHLRGVSFSWKDVPGQKEPSQTVRDVEGEPPYRSFFSPKAEEAQ